MKTSTNTKFYSLDYLGVFSVSGEDATKFLQGQLTADVSSLQNKWSFTANCAPSGKMITCARAFCVDDKYFFILPKDSIEIAITHLQKYAIFNKVNICKENLSLVGIIGADAKLKQDLNLNSSDTNLNVSSKGFSLIHSFGILLLTYDALKVDVEDEASWKVHEICAGFPNIYAPDQDKFIPQMVNLDLLDGVSFTKGCYIGQETVARIKYRGGNKRSLYALKGPIIDTNQELDIMVNERSLGDILDYAVTDATYISVILPSNLELEEDLEIKVAGNIFNILKIDYNECNN